MVEEVILFPPLLSFSSVFHCHLHTEELCELKPAVWNGCLPHLAVRVNNSYLAIIPVFYEYTRKYIANVVAVKQWINIFKQYFT